MNGGARPVKGIVRADTEQGRIVLLRVYVGGSMRNPRVLEVARALREQGYDAFDDWMSPGPAADDEWQKYEQQRGRSYKEALTGHHAKHVFALDKHHIDHCDVFVLVMPCGKSGHLELGYCAGKGKPCFILFESEPERFDIMPLFATDVFFSQEELLEALREEEAWTSMSTV